MDERKFFEEKRMSTQHNTDNYYLPALSHWPITVIRSIASWVSGRP
jgi:hypothetical protein